MVGCLSSPGFSLDYPVAWILRPALKDFQVIPTDKSFLCFTLLPKQLGESTVNVISSEICKDVLVCSSPQCLQSRSFSTRGTVFQALTPISFSSKRNLPRKKIDVYCLQAAHSSSSLIGSYLFPNTNLPLTSLFWVFKSHWVTPWNCLSYNANPLKGSKTSLFSSASKLSTLNNQCSI